MENYLRSYVLILFCFLLFENCYSQCKQVKDIKEDDKFVISKNYIDIIEHADSIVWYLIDSMCEVDTTAKFLQGYGEILLTQIDTIPARCNVLKSTLLYSESFQKLNMVKETLVSAKSFCNVKNLGLISSLGIQPFSLPLFC